MIYNPIILLSTKQPCKLLINIIKLDNLKKNTRHAKLHWLNISLTQYWLIERVVKAYHHKKNLRFKRACKLDNKAQFTILCVYR